MEKCKIFILKLSSCSSSIRWIPNNTPSSFNDFLGPFRPWVGSRCCIWIWISLSFIHNIKILIILILILWIRNISQDIIICKWKWMRNYTFFFFGWLWIMHPILFKLHIVLYEACFGCKVHQFVCLCIICISQQYAFTTLGLEGLFFVHGNYGPSFAAKNSQVWDIRLMSQHFSQRSGPNHLFVRHLVLDIWSTIYILVPYRRRKILFFENTCFHLFQWSIFPLFHTILLWCVGNRVFHSNPFWFT